MRALLALFLCVAAGAAQAQVSVRSGDHAGYARIAFDLPRPRPWSFGRDGDAYVLRMDGASDLDLSRVFRAIGRDKIGTLSATEAGLRLVPACDPCHATAFEARPGTVVIDVKTGAAPAGSRFERTLLATSLRPRLRPDVADAAPALDWTAQPRVPVELPIPPALDPFREAILRQLADGAARGVVDMVERLPPRPDAPPLPPQMRVEEEPGFIRDPDQPMTAEGRTCIPDDRLDLAAWGAEGPVAASMGSMRGGLEGEFDIPDPAAVDRAIRYYLHLGFGAEAAQLAAVYPDAAADPELYAELGRILDGDPAQAPLLHDMAGCAGAAALWGILATPQPVVGSPEDTGAALQAFTALPGHLRRTLAPQLVARLEARGDDTSIRIVQDMLLRTGPDPDPATRLLIARQAEDGGARLTQIVAEGGSGADDALVTLAGRKLAAQQALDGPTLTALQALLKERTGGPEETALQRLVVLGLASTTQFDAAFAMDAPVPELWDWLARTGGEDALLRHAVLGGEVPQDVPLATRIALADRLTDLGLPDPALRWLSDQPATDAERLAAARAQMARRDARAVLRLTAGMDGDAATDLRRRAEAQLQSPPPEAPEPLLTATDTTAGALAQGRALVSGTAEARARIEALLEATALPR